MSLTVTATQSGTGVYDGIALTVKVLDGAAGTGATASSATVTTAELSITPQGTGSWVYGAVTNDAASTTFTPAGTTTFSQNQYLSADTYGFGTFRTTSTTTANTAVTVGSTTTSSTRNLDIALVEILASGTLAEDPSSPATAYTTTAETVSTASFTPPPGSLLVAMVASDFTGTTNQSMTMTVTGGGLTWTLQAVADFTAGTGTFQAVTVWTALVPPVPVMAAIPPGRQSPAAFRYRTWPANGPLPTSSTDTGTSADAGTVTGELADTDTGMAADTGAVTAVYAPSATSAVLVPPAPFTPMGFQWQAAPPFPALPVPAADTDTGIGADTATTETLITVTETGTGTDTSSISATPSGTETGTGADTGSYFIPGAQETGTGADTGTTAARVTAGETGTGDDEATAEGTGTLTFQGAPPFTVTRQYAGVVTLNGTTGITISTDLVDEGSVIMLTVQPGAVPQGTPYVAALVAGSSFTLKSTSSSDTAVQLAWWLVEAA